MVIYITKFGVTFYPKNQISLLSREEKEKEHVKKEARTFD